MHPLIESILLLRPICISLFFIVCSRAAFAGDFPPDGRLLERACQSANQYDQGFCDGYIVGIASGKLTSNLEGAKASPSLGFCLEGKSVSSVGLRSIVLSYIERKRPCLENVDAGYAVMGALVEAYPCD